MPNDTNEPNHPARALRMEDERRAANREEYGAALLAAIERDGWPDEGSGAGDGCNYCDISAAIRAGFPFSAAHLLTGATECPATDTLIRERGGLLKGSDGWPIDWAEWVEWFRANTVRCRKCEAFVFTDEGWPGSCGNCLAKLPEPPDDEEEGEECAHTPAPRVTPPLGAPLPTCAKCGAVYMPEPPDDED